MRKACEDDETKMKSQRCLTLQRAGKWEKTAEEEEESSTVLRCIHAFFSPFFQNFFFAILVTVFPLLIFSLCFSEGSVWHFISFFFLIPFFCILSLII